jgi:hypothetical protein
MLGGRENPIGPGTSGFDFTFGSLMEAMRRHPDQIRLVRDNLLDEEDYASAFAADARLNRDTCNEAILASSAHAPSEDMYSVSLGDGFKVTVSLPSDIEDTFKRGGGGIVPPEGLVHIATEMKIDMTGYRVDGKTHSVYSMGAPKQVDIRLMGSMAITIVELAVVSSY